MPSVLSLLDTRYTDPRQRGYPYDYWRGRDRRRDPQYSGHDNSSMYEVSQSWVDPASISHISSHGHGAFDTMSYTDGHTREDYSMYDHQYEGWEGENPGNYPTEEWIQNTGKFEAPTNNHMAPPTHQCWHLQCSLRAVRMQSCSVGTQLHVCVCILLSSCYYGQPLPNFNLTFEVRNFNNLNSCLFG